MADLSITPEQARENLKKVRDHIAGLPEEKFDMGRWGHPQCGTAACIGGWAEALLFPDGEQSLFVEEVGAALGLDEDQTDHLFYMTDTELHFHEVDSAAAARVLDHLIETGEVDWSKAQADG